MSAPISVIIPTYQHASTIAACLESIFAQTLQPLEVIVVNDGSTDETETILKTYGDRIRVISQSNQGGNRARNAGFAVSTGARVIFCDADVVLRQDMLSRLSAALDEHPEASYAYSGFRFGWKRFRSFPFDADRLRRMNYVHTTSLIRREHFPGFDPTLKRFQDWDVWLTMLSKGHTGIFVHEELFHIQDDQSRKSISQWQPTFLYRIPWKRLGWTPPAIRAYEAAREVILKKHAL